MPLVRSGLPCAAYTIPDDTSIYPYDAGRFHPQLGLPDISAYPRRGGLPYDNEPMQRREYPPVCTDIITESRLYCQQLFLSLSYLLLASSGWVPITLSIDTRYAFSGRRSITFLTLFDFFWLAAERSCWVSAHYHRSQVRTAIWDGGWRRCGGAAGRRWQAGRRVAGCIYI